MAYLGEKYGSFLLSEADASARRVLLPLLAKTYDLDYREPSPIIRFRKQAMRTRQPRKWISCCATALIAVSAVKAQAQAQEAAQVASLALNLRTGPSATNPIIVELPYGHPVSIIARADGWPQVTTIRPDTVEVTTGWVSQRYITASPKGDTALHSTTPKASTPNAVAPHGGKQGGLTVSVANFDCDDDLFEPGFKDCDIELLVAIRGPAWVDSSASLSCDVEVTAITVDGWRHRKNGSEFTSIFVTGGYGSTTVNINVRVAQILGPPVTDARLTEAVCRIM
jgi:uncharacterized protein YraI